MADDLLRRAFDSLWLKSYERNWIPGRLGRPNSDGSYTVVVSEKPGYLYVRLGPEGNQGVTIALNLGVPRRASLPVKMRREGEKLVIYGVDHSGGRLEQFLIGSGSETYNVAPHTHRIGSGLEYEVEALRLEPGRVKWDNALTVYINPFRYYYGGIWDTWPGGYLDLTSYQPSGAGNWGWVLVGVNPATNTAIAVAGTEYSYITPLTLDLLDDISFADYIPCAAIKVKESDTSLSDISRYLDARPWFSTPLIFTGDVTGPVSSTDNAIARWDGTGGDVLQDSGVIIDDSDNLDLGGAQIRDYAEQVTTASVGTTTYGIDWSAASLFELTLTGNPTFTFSNLAASRSITVMLIQDATGNRTVTWPGSVNWPNDEPTLKTAASAIDVLALFVRNDGSTVEGFSATTGTGHTIQDEGVDLTARTNLNFVGGGVAAADDSSNDATKVTILRAEVLADSSGTGVILFDSDGDVLYESGT